MKNKKVSRIITIIIIIIWPKLFIIIWSSVDGCRCHHFELLRSCSSFYLPHGDVKTKMNAITTTLNRIANMNFNVNRILNCGTRDSLYLFFSPRLGTMHWAWYSLYRAYTISCCQLIKILTLHFLFESFQPFLTYVYVGFMLLCDIVCTVVCILFSFYRLLVVLTFRYVEIVKDRSVCVCACVACMVNCRFGFISF